MADKKPAAEKKAPAPKKADAAPQKAPDAPLAEPEAKAPAKAAPGHAERLDKLEQDHAALLDVARANGWSLPE